MMLAIYILLTLPCGKVYSPFVTYQMQMVKNAVLQWVADSTGIYSCNLMHAYMSACIA
jgi:hypothetical protein